VICGASAADPTQISTSTRVAAASATGLLRTALLHPLSVVRTRLAADIGMPPALSGSTVGSSTLNAWPAVVSQHARPQRLYNGIWHCFTDTFGREGFLGLYRGSGLAAVTTVRITHVFDIPSCTRRLAYLSCSICMAHVWPSHEICMLTCLCCSKLALYLLVCAREEGRKRQRAMYMLQVPYLTICFGAYDQMTRLLPTDKQSVASWWFPLVKMGTAAGAHLFLFLMIPALS
jgi:hypothetical protein